MKDDREIDVDALVAGYTERQCRAFLAEMLHELGDLTQAIKRTGRLLAPGESSIEVAIELLKRLS